MTEPFLFYCNKYILWGKLLDWLGKYEKSLQYFVCNTETTRWRHIWNHKKSFATLFSKCESFLHDAAEGLICRAVSVLHKSKKRRMICARRYNQNANAQKKIDIRVSCAKNTPPPKKPNSQNDFQWNLHPRLSGAL